jgi:iron-sulfur cluster assembly accessory protein
MKIDIITVTPAAQKYVNDRLNHNELLLVKLNNKGCSGNSIEYSLIEQSKIGKYDELILWQDGGLVIESTSVMGLLGSELDVNDSILESVLVWRNPQATNHCGCGTSFELKSCEQA